VLVVVYGCGVGGLCFRSGVLCSGWAVGVLGVSSSFVGGLCVGVFVFWWCRLDHGLHCPIGPSPLPSLSIWNRGIGLSLPYLP